MNLREIFSLIYFFTFSRLDLSSQERLVAAAKTMDYRTGALATVEKLAAILSINLGATEH